MPLIAQKYVKTGIMTASVVEVVVVWWVVVVVMLSVCASAKFVSNLWLIACKTEMCSNGLRYIKMRFCNDTNDMYWSSSRYLDRLSSSGSKLVRIYLVWVTG